MATATSRSVQGSQHKEEGVSNQDAHFVVKTEVGGEILIGVFDGHGEKGGEASKLASSIMKQSLLRRLETNNGVTLKTIMVSSFAETSQKLSMSDCGKTSGTTATVAIIKNNECIVGYVGDSCGVLYQKGLMKLNARYILQPHRPGICKIEDTRIKAYGGLCHDGYVVDQVSRKKGIAITRTLGDIDMLINGCISEPEILSFRILNRDVAFVMATDGLWDSVGVNVKSIASVIESNLSKNVERLCDSISKLAGEQPFDDCTVIVVKLGE